MERYQVTGNEYVSLPTIRERDGGVEGITCLYMGLKGMLELRGEDCLLQPFFQVNGGEMTPELRWRRERFWIPVCEAETEELRLSCTYLTPVGERGFAIRLRMENISAERQEVSAGVRGNWAETLHTVNESISLKMGREAISSGWNGMFIFQQVPGVPMIAFAPVVSDHSPFSEVEQGAEWEQRDFEFRIWKKQTLVAGEKLQLDLFFGLGYEQVAAATSAKEMLRQGFDTVMDRTRAWLSAREKHIPDPDINTLLNTNLFFAFFYASGRTIDTEELCMMTSRSPRYYVSAAYWDRDSLLWAFPAIVETDARYARELLLTVFHRQSRNFGVHSRYIDGTVLEPGFELDELCAPVIALHRYVESTGDRSVLHREEIREALAELLRKLEERKHPAANLYSTFLQPTDDKHHYPYLTYDNVLVWRVCRILGEYLEQPALTERAEQVRRAIEAHCVFEHEGKRIYAWSVDMTGNWDIYDEPPGSLQLLPFYGYCDQGNEIWQNTVQLIRNEEYSFSFAGHAIAEIGCKHAPHPWVLSICNSLLSGHAETALMHLRATHMDNGIACESVHEDTGECTTGEAFATCAGFLSYALMMTAARST